MFIYKITVIPLNQVYIGMDTGPVYKKSRWRAHQRESIKNPKTKLHIAMNTYGIDNCIIEVIQDGFLSIANLAIAEINYIKKYDSYHNGLNSTPGGDGLGQKHLKDLSEQEILQIKQALGEHFKNYNKNIKWANTSLEERRNMISYLYTDEISKKKSASLKEFYKANPEVAMSKSSGIKNWQLENREKLKYQNSINSKKGAEKVSKKLKVEKEDGTILFYNSKSEFHRKTGQWANTILKKTKNGEFYNGYKVYEI